MESPLREMWVTSKSNFEELKESSRLADFKFHIVFRENLWHSFKTAMQKVSNYYSFRGGSTRITASTLGIPAEVEKVIF